MLAPMTGQRHEKMKLSKKQLLLLLSGIIIILFGAVWAFTRPAPSWSISLANKPGEIGDAINGMTAPITSIIGSFLIYLSLSAQVNANSLIQSQWTYDTFVRVFNDIQNEYSNLKYTSSEQARSGAPLENVIYHGSEALTNFVIHIRRHLSQPQIGILNDLSFMLEDLTAVIHEVDESDLPIDRKRFILERIDRFFTAKIQIPTNQIKSGLESAPNNIYNYQISTIDRVNQAIDFYRRKYINNNPEA